MTTIIRHEIDPTIIANSVAWRIAENKRLCEQDIKYRQTSRPQDGIPNTPEVREQIVAFFDAANLQEQNHYSRPRVIETQRPSEASQFRLIYGDDQDAPDTGTGSFVTLEAATNWYATHGR